MLNCVPSDARQLKGSVVRCHYDTLLSINMSQPATHTLTVICFPSNINWPACLLCSDVEEVGVIARMQFIPETV